MTRKKIFFSPDSNTGHVNTLDNSKHQETEGPPRAGRI